MTKLAVLAPGFGGGPEQRILRALEARLAQDGVSARSVAFRSQGRRPSRGYVEEMEDVRMARDALLAEHAGPGKTSPVALIGRSFGGRICAFLAASEPPAALAVLGYPIAPPGRPRPQDEAALLAITCPALIVQGDHDELGPLDVLERLAASNPRLRLHVVHGATHSFGKQEPAALDAVARWLAEVTA